MNCDYYRKPRLISEIGCNHKGEMKIAKELIKMAAIYCKADVVKFQKRCNKELLTVEQYNAPHPNPANAFGKTYGQHREYLEFSSDQHKELKEYCEECGIEYSYICLGFDICKGDSIDTSEVHKSTFSLQ